MNVIRLAACAIVACCVPSVAPSAEIAVLNESNWSEFAPGGKEVDAIYGDIVLRNDKLVAVIANPIDGRHANLTVKNVGGALIDFTTREAQNDQLAAFFPLGKAVNYRAFRTSPPLVGGATAASGNSVSVTVTAKLTEALTVETTYSVLDTWSDLIGVHSRITNSSAADVEYVATDDLVMQGSVVRGVGDLNDIKWVYDRWWDAAYGVRKPGAARNQIKANDDVEFYYEFYLAADLVDLLTAKNLTFSTTPDCRVKIVDDAGRPIAHAYVQVDEGTSLVSAGRTNENGEFTPRAARTTVATISHPSYGEQAIRLDRESVTVTFPACGAVVAAITDESGGPIPCKVKFTGVGDTKDPVFFDKTGEESVGNLYYSHDGKFTRDLPPGKYDVTISHGPEYDIVEQRIEVRSGSPTPLAAKLVRSVQTPGWISADFHNHATPSGDNSSSQFGRVLNLLAEHVEFAPCTEHNRISSYGPHLARLKAEHLMATCTGIELTGYPFSVNHHNAFPLKMHEHTQDGGGPTVDADPEVSIERLVLWDDRSPKLIQQNHPDLGWLYFDKNADGVPDEGFQRALGHLDCIEVHPPHDIFEKPTGETKDGKKLNNAMFNWLQLLNQGHRIPGVVNTDAHYNIHGSGWLRNYIECSTDDPAKIDVAEMVHAAEHGHMVMTNAPFLEAIVRAGDSRGGPGDDVLAGGGKAELQIRVQCANWYDIDRVQVFLNGKPDPKLNFTRQANPDAFGDGVVKFERTLSLTLDGDTHVIVAAIGENSGLGHVMGPEHEHDKPTAVTNAIYVDVDGGGFQVNKDTLGAPLPVRAPGSK